MSNISWRVGAISASTVYHDLCIGDERSIDTWIAEFTIEGARVFQFTHIRPESYGLQVRSPMRSTLDEAKADAAMHFANKELERP